MSIHLLNNNISIVELCCPYLIYEKNEYVRFLLSELIKFRFESYKPKYPLGVIPAGKDDYFSDHIIVFQNSKIIAAFESSHNFRCQTFGIEFPLQAQLFPNIREGEHQTLNEILKIINECESQNQEIAFNLHWAKSHKITDPNESKLIRDILFSIFYHYYTEKNINFILSAGNVKLKVPKLMEKMGFQNLQNNEPITAGGFHGANALIMLHKNRSYSDEFKQNAENYKRLWSNRKTIGIEAYRKLLDQTRAA